MTRSLSLSLVCAASLAAAHAVHANTVQYTYTFTAADVLSRQYVNGADGTTAAQNGLFDGARLLRVGTSGSHQDAGRTHIASQHTNFDSRWAQYTDDGYVLDWIGLWGFDGNGANWGEDFKPSSWVGGTAPAGWEVQTWQWQWGTPPAGYLTLDSLRFVPTDPSFAYALDEDPAFLETQVFTFTFEVDPNDAFWGQNTNGAPNTLGGDMTFWFGGYVSLYDTEGNQVDSHLYEGNMVIPEPASLMLLGLGSMMMLRRRR